MEIGQHGADEAEFVAGVDEEIRVAGAGSDFSVGLLSGKFQGADCGGSHGYDAAGGAEGLGNFCRRFCGDRVKIGVKFVVFDYFGANGLESSEAHVEGDLGGFDAASFYSRENFRGEVESGGGG